MECGNHAADRHASWFKYGYCFLVVTLVFVLFACRSASVTVVLQFAIVGVCGLLQRIRKSRSDHSIISVLIVKLQWHCSTGHYVTPREKCYCVAAALDALHSLCARLHIGKLYN